VLPALFAACAGDAAREADRPYTAGVARVERIELELVSTRPPRLRVDVHGSLPDACTQIDRVETRRFDARVEIAIRTRRPFGARCAEAPVPFTRSVPVMLEEEFRFYVVDVNGVSWSVVLPPGHPPDPFERVPLE
jgi:inhibitor of cysteine peptidase